MENSLRTSMGLLAVAALLMVTGTANATLLYTFTIIAEAKGGTSGPIEEFAGNPTINNFGTVAFVARLPQEVVSTREVVFTGSGGPLTTIGGPPGNRIAGSAAINDAGEVTFLNGPTGVFKGSGGSVTTRACPVRAITESW